MANQKIPSYLNIEQRQAFMEIPSDLSERDLARHYSFTPEELKLIQSRRRPENRFGFAGRPLAGDPQFFQNPESGLDHRLNSRFYRDPPEFSTALHGNTDGLHFGLWYDNPQESSAFVASYYSRDGGGVAYQGQTLLEAVRKQIEWSEYHIDDLR